MLPNWKEIHEDFKVLQSLMAHIIEEGHRISDSLPGSGNGKDALANLVNLRAVKIGSKYKMLESKVSEHGVTVSRRRPIKNNMFSSLATKVKSPIY